MYRKKNKSKNQKPNQTKPKPTSFACDKALQKKKKKVRDTVSIPILKKLVLLVSVAQYCSLSSEMNKARAYRTVYRIQDTIEDILTLSSKK